MFKKILGEAKGIFNVITLMDIIISVIFILFGLLYFINPNSNITLTSILTGFILIANAGSCIFSYLKRGDIVLYNFNIIFGIILLILGLIALFLGKNLTIALGIYYLVVCAQKIGYSFYLKKFNEKSWVFNLVVGILFIILGIITFFTDKEAVVEVTGICLLGYGFMNLVSTILLRKRSQYFIA